MCNIKVKIFICSININKMVFMNDVSKNNYLELWI